MQLPTNLDALMGGRSLRDILKSVRVLLSTPEHWSVGAPARDAQGQAVKPTDPAAVCWCIEGAVAACANELGIIPLRVLQHLDAVAQSFLGPDPAHTAGFFNDHVGGAHEQVLVFLDRAIELA